MIRQGIRISRQIVGGESVPLPSILEEIQNGNQYHWSILELEASGNLGEGISIPDFEKQIFKMERGLFIDWNDLVQMSKKFDEIIWIFILGSRDQALIHRYENDQEKCEGPDFVIEMFDSSYWEIFSADEQFIRRLAIKFPKHELLFSNYLR